MNYLNFKLAWNPIYSDLHLSGSSCAASIHMWLYWYTVNAPHPPLWNWSSPSNTHVNNGGDNKCVRVWRGGRRETCDSWKHLHGSVCHHHSDVLLDMGQNGSSLHVEMKISLVPLCVSIRLCFKCLTTCQQGAFTVIAAAWLCQMSGTLMISNQVCLNQLYFLLYLYVLL